MTTKYFDVKNGLSAGNITLDAANGNTSTTNLTVTANTNLGNVGNITITGGSNGQVLTTDGSGVLSFADAGGGNGGFGNLAAPMPAYIASANSYLVSANFQGLFAVPITIDGELAIDGVLVDVNSSSSSGGGNGTPGGSNTQIQYNNSGAFDGNSQLTFNNTTGILSVPEMSVTGNIIPTSNLTYSLGNNTNRFNNLYLSGNITSLNANLGNLVTANYLSGDGYLISNITVSAGSAITNGNSNVNVAPNANVTISANNVANVVIVTGTNTTFNSNVTANNNVIVSGTVTAANITANTGVFTGNGSGLNSITGANVTGNVGNALNAYAVAGANVSGQVANALVAGTVYTNAQPNITSVGTLTGLTVSGDILPSANITYNLGSPTQKFKDLYLSGNSIILGAQTLSATASGVDLTGTLTVNGVISGGFLIENSQTVAANYTITAGKSAMSSGPMTINTGVTVTIPLGSRWVIL